MKRIAKAAAWLALFGLAALLPFLAASLPVSREEMIRGSYRTWTGVLRLWKCAEADAVSGSGSLNSWLNSCIAAFEKRHPGVYVQLTEVSGETLSSFADDGGNPPDMLLYAPGMMDAPYSLMPVERRLPLRGALQEFGLWQGTRYAVPVALGGYAMAVNAQMMDGIPDRWSAFAVPEEGDILNAPADGEYVSWSAALLSLFAGSRVSGEDAEGALVGDGIDLGLPEDQETEAPGKEMKVVENVLPSVLPEDFRTEESVYAPFTKETIAAIPVTQREIRRLQLLSESGKGPDWRVEAMGLPFTDQAALFSIVAWPRDDIHERQALAMELLEIMLSEAMQEKLTAVRAFAAADLTGLYPRGQGMEVVEEAICSDGLITPPAFGKAWRTYADSLMDGIQAGGSTQEAYRMLQDAFRAEQTGAVR